jgi:POT family proton-dependent oligopeptide transporter
MGFNFTPLKKIQAGFVCAMLSMVVAALIQHFIYEKSPCGKDASSCDDAPPLTVWVQAPVRVDYHSLIQEDDLNPPSPSPSPTASVHR